MARSRLQRIERLQLQRAGLEEDGDTPIQGVIPQDPSKTMSLDERQSLMFQQHRERTEAGHGPNGTTTSSFARLDTVRNPHSKQPRHTSQTGNISVPSPSSATTSPPPTKISLLKPENEALPVERPNRTQSSAPEAPINMATQKSRPAALAPPIWCEKNFVKFLQNQNAGPPNNQPHQKGRPAEGALSQQARQKTPPKVAHTRLLFSEYMRQHSPQALRLKEALRQPDLVGPKTSKTIQNARTHAGLYQSPSLEAASHTQRRRVGKKTFSGYAQPAAQQPLWQQGRRSPGIKTDPGTQREATVAGNGSPSIEVDLSPHMTPLSMSPTRQNQPYRPAQDAQILNGPMSYLNQIKVQFADRPDIYKRFLNIMRAFKSDT